MEGAAATKDVIYLDNAATTRPYPEVVEVVARAMRDEYGNPSSQHAAGKRAKRLLTEARETVAAAFGADPDEIFFTSGGTESNNLAITGLCAARARANGHGRIVTSTLEHPSVTKTVRGNKRDGWGVDYLEAVGGNLDMDALERLLQEPEEPDLITVMAVQSELGYRFPIADIVSLRDRYAPNCIVHTDAVQAFGKLDMDVRRLGVDLMSASSHKIGGPKGIGALYVKRGTELFTTAFGGGQEKGLRSGTEALPAILGFAEAARITSAAREATYERVSGLRDRLVDGLRALYRGVIVNSRPDGSPFVVNFSIPGSKNKRVLSDLSDRGIYLSASTACASNAETVEPGTWREKHPLALQLAGVPKSLTLSTYRVSMFSSTTAEDVEALLAAFAEVLPPESL